MTNATIASPPPYDAAAVGAAIDAITAGLERVTAGFSTLKALLAPPAQSRPVSFDPKDPANKQLIGGLEKLTPRGVEICYRLFDAGNSRYAVASLMIISFGAANHRFAAWQKLGGINSVKQPL
jgi:hypothetical protein